MLKTLQMQNFTVFQNAQLEFSPGLNVIIGENGTGKSHLLKIGYSLLSAIGSFGEKKPSKEVAGRAIAQELVDVFRPEALGRLVSRAQGNKIAKIAATWNTDGTIDFSLSRRRVEKVDIGQVHYSSLPYPTLFFPPKEIISVFFGFQGTLEKRELDFDSTYLALAKALNNAPLKENRPKEIDDIINEIENIIGAKVVKKNNRFYFISKKNHGMLEAQLIAEGYRKLGMLYYLALNGEIRKSTSLFWDEPEANLNPALLAKLAEILAKLSAHMQITIATHSLFLLKEFTILQMQEKIDNIMYFGIHKSNDETMNIIQNKSIEAIGDIASLDASINQSDMYMQLSYEEQ